MTPLSIIFNGWTQTNSEIIEKFLRIVQTKFILFLKTMSERVGSEIERLWILNYAISIDFESILKFNFRVVLCRIRLFPTLISKIKWLGSKLPLKFVLATLYRVKNDGYRRILSTYEANYPYLVLKYHKYLFNLV